MRIASSFLTAFFGFFLVFPALALDVGEEMPAFTLKDQKGEERSYTSDIQRIYANADRTADKIMKEGMKELKQADLDAQKAIAVADISEAPGFVKRIIRSSLKKRSYDTWLDSKGKSKKWMSYRPDRVSLIELKDGRITAIRYIANAEELIAALQEKSAEEPAKTLPTDTDPTTPENSVE